MKSIEIICLSVCISAAFMTGCDDYKSPVSGSDGNLSSISVISSDIAFPAAGGSGVIAVSAPAGVTAETSAPWCHLSVEGMKVSVNVDETTTRYGRTAVIVLRSAGDSLKVPCMQKGYTLSYELPVVISSKNEGGSFKYLLKSNLTATISTTEDWITVFTENDSLNVTIKENPSSAPRSGRIMCTIGGEKDTIKVNQLDAEKLIPGVYEIQGYLYGNWNKEYTAQANVELSKENTLAYYSDSPEGSNKKKTVDLYKVTFPHLIRTVDGKVDQSPEFELAYYPEGGYLSWMTSVASTNWKTCYIPESKKVYFFSSLVATSELDENGANGYRLVVPRNSFGHYNAVPELDADGNLLWRFKDSGLYGYKFSNKSVDGWGVFFNTNRSSITTTTKGSFFFVAKNTVMKRVSDL